MIKSAPFNFTLRLFVRLLLIAPLNIFIIAIPSLITLVTIVLLWSLTFSLFAASFTIPAIAFQTELVSLSFWSILATFFTSFFTFFASIALGLIVFFISKHFYTYMFDYIRWNFNFIFKDLKTVK